MSKREIQVDERGLGVAGSVYVMQSKFKSTVLHETTCGCDPVNQPKLYKLLL